MTPHNSSQVEEEFIEAKNYWELEKLYVDLGLAKGKSLTPVEKKFLRGLLCGFSPAEIASTVYQSRSSSTVRVYLSNGLYKYIEEMLTNQAGHFIKVKNWSRVTQLLEKAGYKKARVQLEPLGNQLKIDIRQDIASIDMRSVPREDWGEAPDVSLFYGRVTELSQIEQWIVGERCRLVMILGMSGVGKTAFSAKLAEQLKDKFECVIWRSLNLNLSPDILLNQLIQILSPKQELNLTESFLSRISQLIDCLRSSRCLIILDNFDSILYNQYIGLDVLDELSIQQSLAQLSTKNSSAYILPQISYCQGYEIYGEILRRVGDSQHQSCLIVTSREKPQEISVLEGKFLPVRCLKLTGLSYIESKNILQAKGLMTSQDEECKSLINWYAGNPLFIKLVATAIEELFGGSINNFLEQGTVVFGDIRAILDRQFNRLSSLEKLIMYWLALNQDLVSVRKLQKDFFPRVSQRLILEAIELLQKRSLIEKKAANFSQIPVLMEYIGEQLIEENLQMIGETEGSLLMSYTILEHKIKNYIREMRQKSHSLE
ncbi:AAA family ATPase [Scytonema sp. UIC 10036]|uniref:NB-ARC domain-containing protein n=1 Tax=Scytonema sp. UIC 10036 TaxID=2304196 RepID=UPI0012DA2354|nr:ATP-binding protein [Scytonema sp. UIC 10036]MUG99936.1 AAA family ATPase [Scytonema sp. UIC 10036]